jgi:hypothetical protein
MKIQRRRVLHRAAGAIALSMISAGLFLGAPTANHPLAS